MSGVGGSLTQEWQAGAQMFPSVKGIPFRRCPHVRSALAFSRQSAWSAVSYSLRRSQLVALAAACALALSTAVYSAHGLAVGGQEHVHCDLCVHFSGTAGSPPPPAVLAKPVLVVRVLPARPQVLLPVRSPLGMHLPRGPPHSAFAAI